MAKAPAVIKIPVLAGFEAVGRLYTSHDGSNDTKDDRSVIIPGDAPIDWNFQMGGTLVNSGGGASSDLTASDIPAGFFVKCGGTDGNGRRWAVLKPYSGTDILVATVSGGRIKHYKFTLGLYSDNGSGFFDPGHGGSNTWVDVFYKKK